jgi:hypothetical protein
MGGAGEGDPGIESAFDRGVGIVAPETAEGGPERAVVFISLAPDRGGMGFLMRISGLRQPADVLGPANGAEVIA